MNEEEYLTKKNKFLKEFILLYKSLPCLWNSKSKEYYLRGLRTRAYEAMVKKMREIAPSADRNSVVKKINCLRSCLRKEKRKVEAMAEEGVVYEPKLWYYTLFNFLDDAEQNSRDYQSVKREEPFIKLDEEGIPYVVEYIEEDQNPLDSFEKSHDDDESSRDNASPPPPRRAKKSVQTEFVQASSSKAFSELKTSNKHLDDEPSIHESRQDQCEVFGKHVAAKLRNIAAKDEMQKLMAEKIINDALFMAEMGKLTLEHCSKLH